MEYTEQVAEFTVGTTYERIPPKALDLAKQVILDSVGVALAGSREAPSQICARLARDEGGLGKAALFGHGLKSSPLMAALVNGTSSHVLDYDCSFVLMGQPTSGLVAAIFSVAETLGSNGQQLLEAFVAGFEVTTKLAWSIPELSSKVGWHSTATLGSLGTTAACAKLFRLDSQAVRMALGIASSMASGFVWNFGTMTKPLHAGLAARNGLLAATLARDGFTANPSVLEKQKGFFDTYGRGIPYDPTPLKSLGSSYELVESGVKFKAYPCGGLTHSAIDAVLAIRGRHQFSPKAIDRIEVAVTQYTYNHIAYSIPKNGLEGKFSMAYVLARAIRDGALTVDTFTDEAVRDAAVLFLAQKVEMKVEPKLTQGEDGSRPCEVVIRLKDGREFSRRVDYPKGSAQSPITAEELRAKFLSCAQRALSDRAAGQALEMLEHLEGLNNIASLCDLLTGKP